MNATPGTAPEIITFGCRLNTYESAAIGELARTAGLTDTVIVNTCAVTAEAERQARQAIRKARRERPGAQIIVTGCAAQIDPQRYAGMAEVDRVLGNREKLEAASFSGEAIAPVQVGDIMALTETAGHMLGGFEGRSRAFVEIQQGCDHRCTFCIIPFGRGNNRSAPIGAIAEQTRTLVEAGYREVVLTGVDIAGYGRDLPGAPSLGQLVRRLLAAVPELPRLRLSSIDPAVVDGDLLRAVAEEERLMPHLHLSLQAGDDLILKRMKRRHSRAQALALTERLRALRPDIAFGADLIAGFPTESESAFANTLALVEDCGLAFLHVFPYSERPGTPAARMPQLPKPVRKARAKALRAAGEAAQARFLDSRIGKTEAVLVEAGSSSRTAHYAPIRLTGAHPRSTIVEATVTARDGDTLFGQVV
ncbi:MAG: tRNA (N(6)-L-threonylcarbamoyladenosine(37)-C(2))-methylthiotransferase MtaB [Alphaproteobacteria bacterium]|nr:tRNA (N(6)-L-threonylcarbamoyladenosine(37)-C(2))-methylthiotransferase MtaB [Alphaproteobacteria bacterium]